MTVHDHVMRRMYPDASGTPIDLDATYPQTHDVTVNLTLDEIYVPWHCTLVYFVQEMGGREVHQAGKVDVGDLATPIYAADGRLVRRLHRGTLVAGFPQFAWDGRDEHGLSAASSVYVTQVSDGAGRQQSRRLTLNSRRRFCKL